LLRALEFLGQAVPACLHGAPPAELLPWAVENFDARAIPPAAGGLACDDFPG